MTPRRQAQSLVRVALVASLCAIGVMRVPSAQQRGPDAVRPIDPLGIALPPESESAGETRFSFIVYGDTRHPPDGEILQPGHSNVVDHMIASASELQAEGFPVRFILQTGDAVQDGRVATHWNVSFTPILERLIRQTRAPYFFAVGNHDVDFGNEGQRQVGDPDRELGLRNTSAAMTALWPKEGSPRRLDRYPTFGFGYGHYFVLAIDSNIAFDDTQFNWVSRQLEALDRTRYPHVVAFFHHPVLSSGRHGGAKIEPQSDLMRRRFLPLFRRHHVRMTIAGHDHFYDHFVERYDDASGSHRMDHIVTAGGGAPVYTYRGEPDLDEYAKTAAPQSVRVEHSVHPGSSEQENPHHFLVVEVDENRVWLRVIGVESRPFRPYGEPRVELTELVPVGAQVR